MKKNIKKHQPDFIYDDSIERTNKYKPMPCAILWLDILDFKTVLKGIELGDLKSNYRLAQIEKAFSNENLSSYFFWPFELSTFGDTFVLLFRYYEGNKFYQEMSYRLPFQIAEFQYNLVKRGILVRGACEAGMLVSGTTVSSGTIFAPLYRAEDIIAVTPRIIFGGLDNNGVLEQHFDSLRRGATNLKAEEYATATDFDGREFIDYLNIAAYSEDTEFFSFHRDLIQNGLSEFKNNTHVRKKYEWLAWYHNYAVLNIGFCCKEINRNLNTKERDELLIYGKAKTKISKLYDRYSTPSLPNWDGDFEWYHDKNCEWCATMVEP